MLVRHRDFAQKIPDDIISAKEYEGKKPLIFVLFRHNDKFDWAIFDLDSRQLLPINVDIEMLNIIQSVESTQTPGIDPNVIEQASHKCIQAWCEKNNTPPNEVTRICALYLLPKENIELFPKLFDQ